MMNTRDPRFGAYPEWFEHILRKHPHAYSSAVRPGGRGDVIVCWRRGSLNHLDWNPTGSKPSMVVLGDIEPSAAEMSSGNIGVQSGSVGCLWLSYLHRNDWCVLPEGSRGKFRPWGQLVKLTPETLADLRKYVWRNDGEA
jgi:hypothetical protein